MELNVLKHDGTVLETVKALDEVFNIEVNKQAVHDAVVSKQASLRQGTHSTLRKGEVSGGGKKPFKQKHTGRARAGSIRSPIWRGGGISFGPQPERNYILKVNKKVQKLAMKSVLSYKANNNEIVVIDPLVIEKPSTKEIIKLITNIKLDPKFKKILLVNENENVVKSIKNIPWISTTNLATLDVVKLLNADVVVLEKAHIEKLQEVLK